MDNSLLRLTDSFTEGMHKLNERQRTAVQSLDGPVLVLAGPGTGKTEVLSLRVGHILAETGLHAENILCLTFSRAGVASMRKRLLELMGSEAERVTVETFHSFAQRILSGKDQALQGRQLLTNADQYMLLEDLLADQSVAGDFFEEGLPSAAKLKRISKIFDLLKKEGINGPRLIELADYCINVLLPAHPDYAGIRVALNQAGKALQKKLIRFRDAIGPLFQAYQERLAEQGKCDFGDLIQEGINTLRTDPDLLHEYQIRYHYILVDEFQDTNAKQLELLLLLTQGIEHPNLFIVGDDDQCIYRFQGATQGNFEAINNQFPDIKTIYLDTNYRSTAEILAHAFSLIEANPSRHPSKAAPLQAGARPNWKLSPSVPELQVYEKTDQEDFAIASRIRDLLHDPSFTGTAAVLCRRNLELQGIVKWLDAWEIAYRIGTEKSDLLKTDQGKRLLWACRTIDLLGIDEKIAGNYFSHWVISTAGREKLLLPHLRWKSEKRPIAFTDWLETQSDDHSGLLRQQLTAFKNWSRDKAVKLDEPAFSRLLDECGVTEPLEIEAWKECFGSFVQTNPTGSLESFCSLLHYHEVHAIEIPYTAPANNQERVVLSTIWGSKGLEYDAVFVKGCVASVWENRKSSPREIRVPQLLNRYIPDESDAIEDLRRVIYVAATRAKCRLSFSYAKENDKGGVQELTSLLNGLILTGVITVHEPGTITVPDLPRTFTPLVATAELRGLVQDFVQNFTISPSSLYNWEHSPDAFFLQNICKVADLPQKPLAFGSYLHKILERLTKEAVPRHWEMQVREIAHAAFPEFAAAFHRRHHRRILHHAVHTLVRYIRLFGLPEQQSGQEKLLAAQTESGTPLLGIVDHIVVTEDAITVTDYKTGSTKWNPEPFRSVQETGSGHWRQAMIYRYLIASNYPGRKQYTVKFHFVEQCKEAEFFYEENPGFWYWLDKVRNEINYFFKSI